MKTIYTLFFIIISMFATSAFGQSVDEKEIRFLESHWTELLNQGNTDALQEIWSKEYVVNNPNGKIVTSKEIILLIKNGHQFPLVERIIEKITFNHNIAIVMGKELQQPANKLEDRNIWIPRRFTNVWIKVENNWKLAARQSSEIIQ